jgi:lycopene beta-cyclase
MPVEYDAVIVGAGLSGLSLANRLTASSSPVRRILVIDDGHHDTRTRAWAYWTREDTWLSPAATATWRAMAVHAAGSSAVLPIDPYRYVAISGERLHDALHERLSASPHVEFVTGLVDAVRDDRDHAVIAIDGADVTAHWAFDSRVVTADPSDPRLAFLGWEIEAGDDAFDPAVATFMDFRGRRPGAASFCYLLPHTTRHALVEVASFQWEHDGLDLAAALTDYLGRVRGLPSWTVTRTEAGGLPLVRPPTGVRDGRVVPIGIRGGMLKPSTGFALERIQRHGAALAESLRRHGHPHAVAAHHRRHAWLDRVFLDALGRDPDIVEDVMLRLFTRNTAPSVLRFLDEDSTSLQEARLVATLPVLPFLRAAVRPRRSP